VVSVAGSGDNGQAGRVDAAARSGHLAFICAMPMELRPLVKKLSLHQTQMGGVTVRAGGLGDRRVVAIVTGMGTKLARAGTERLLEAVEVEEVVVVGITGGVDDDTPIGALIRPEIVVDSVTGTEYRPAPKGDQTPKGKMWTTDGLTTDLDFLAELRSQGVVALDMETAAIAASCEARGIPWSVFRAISDRATDGSINEEVFHLSHQDGTPDKAAVARYFLKHPTHVTRMAALARASKMATEAAAKAAIQACSPT